MPPKTIFKTLLVACASASCALSNAQSNYPTPYSFTTVAGVFSAGLADGPGTAARFNHPCGVATDSSGNVYVVDNRNHTIRKITPAGVTTTVAGAAGYPGSEDGAGAAARFDFPFDIAVDSSGNLYVSDRGNNTIRKITPSGSVSTLAGKAGQAGSSDGTGASASFLGPTFLAVDATGNAYVADNDTVIRKISPGGVVTTLAGVSGVHNSASPSDPSRNYQAGSDGTGSAATFNSLDGLALDSAGTLYVSESNPAHPSVQGADRIRKISPAGVVTTLPLSGPDITTPGTNGFFGGGISVDGSGALYVCSTKQGVVFKITSTGATSIFAGTDGFHILLNSYADGVGPAARFFAPIDIALDNSGNLYVADSENNAIRRITPGAAVTTFAGLAWLPQMGSSNGTGETARFSGFIQYLAAAPSGDIYTTDPINRTVRKITSTGVVTTFIGQSGTYGHVDGSGTAALLSDINLGLTTDKNGNIYVPEISTGQTTGFTIRKASPEGVVTTLNVPLDTPRRECVIDSAGNFFFPNGSTIVKLSAGGTLTNFAGNSFIHGNGDGTGNTATFSDQFSLAIDKNDNLYVADTGNHTIRKVTPDGAVTTMAGTPGASGSDDGTGSAAKFFAPYRVAADSAGNVYVADTGNETIRKITAAGVVTTLAGLVGDRVTANGVGNEARFLDPLSIVVDASANLYVPTQFSIRKGQLAGAPLISSQPQNVTAKISDRVQFSVDASAAPAPTYQWYFNGKVFSGATTSALTLENVQASDAGDYTVAVTNAVGSTTSSKATLTVSSTPVPAPSPPSSSSSGGGGGATEPWVAVAFLVLTISSASWRAKSKTRLHFSA